MAMDRPSLAVVHRLRIGQAAQAAPKVTVLVLLIWRTCPAGQVRQMSKTRTVTFGAACAACPMRSLCTTARDGRSMAIHPHDGLLRAARAQARTEEFKRAYPTPAPIERTIASVAPPQARRG